MIQVSKVLLSLILQTVYKMQDTQNIPSFNTMSTEAQRTSLSTALQEIAGQITKKDKYQACIDLCDENDSAIDIITMNDYLKGIVRSIGTGKAIMEYYRELLIIRNRQTA